MFINKTIESRYHLTASLMLILSSVSFLYAEVQKPLKEVIAEKVKLKRQKPTAPVHYQEMFDQYDPNSVVAQAIQLTKDPNELTKKFGYNLLGYAGYKYDAPHIRKPIVQALVGGLKDKSFSRVKTLMNYRKKDFSKEAKAILKQHFDEVVLKGPRCYNAKTIILLIGVADIQTEMDRLQEIIDSVDEPLQYRSKSRQWVRGAIAALKARARMGDKDAIQRCISIVDSESDEDFKVRVLLKQIEYIRQPEAVEYIKYYLYSDKKARDLGRDALGGPYFYSAANCFEKMIVGFPTVQEARKAYYEKRSTDPEFSNKQVKFFMYYAEYCRQWLESQTPIEILR